MAGSLLSEISRGRGGTRLGSVKPYLSLHLCQAPSTLLLSQYETERRQNEGMCVCTRVCFIMFYGEGHSSKEKKNVLMPGELS